MCNVQRSVLRSDTGATGAKPVPRTARAFVVALTPGTRAAAPDEQPRDERPVACSLSASVITLGAPVARLNWGCGPTPPAGWINSDRLHGDGIHISCDIRDGLPLPDATFDYAVSIHGLQDLPYLDVLPALQELRRVLRPGGALRLGLPDLDRALAAYARGERDYFYIPDAEAATLGGKLIVQIVWYGSVRTPFTAEFARELLLKAGFRRVERCAYGRTSTPHAAIVELDNRERESLFVEAVA
jgi:predicted SAM-dependent methyltransferase